MSGHPLESLNDSTHLLFRQAERGRKPQALAGYLDGVGEICVVGGVRALSVQWVPETPVPDAGVSESRFDGASVIRKKVSPLGDFTRAVIPRG